MPGRDYTGERGGLSASALILSLLIAQEVRAMRKSRELPPPRLTGMSLVECLVILAMTGALMAAAVPRLAGLGAHLSVYQTQIRLTGVIERARFLAIHTGLPVTLCPIGGDGGCSTDWHRPLAVFFDPSGRYRPGDDPVSRSSEPATDQPVYLIMRPSWRRALHFQPDGTAPGMQGHLAFCTDTNAASAGRLVFSSGGRTRYVRGDPDQRGCRP